MIAAVRRLPPAFVLALLVQGLIVAARLAFLASGSTWWMTSASWALTSQGVSFVTLSLLAAGAFDLARRTSSPAADAARIAGIVFTTAVGMSVAGILLHYFQMTRTDGAPPIEVLYDIESYAWSLLMIGGIAALVTAGDGWRRVPALAGVAMVGIVISRAPPVLGTPLYEALYGALGRAGASMVFSLSWLAALGAVAALIAGTEKAEPAEDGPACERGLRRTSSALWIRVIAAALFVAIAMFAMVGRRGGGAASVAKFLMVAGPALNAFALGSFGFGAFTAARSGVRDFSSYALYGAGALSLWAAGAMLTQLPWLYQRFYRDDRGSFGGDHGSRMVETLTLGIPLVAGAGVVALTIAIAGFARRRDLQDLRDQTSARAAAFVVLIIASLVIVQYGLPKARSEGMFLAMSFAAAGAGLCAIAMMAKLCSLAADAVRQAPGLPTATLRPPD